MIATNKRAVMIITLTIGLLLYACLTTVLATTHIVTNTLDSGSGSLREAITNATAGDLITFDASLAGQTITLATELTIDKNLTISSTIPISISGNNSVRIFNVTGGTAKFNNLYLINGSAVRGGAIQTSNAGTMAIVENSTFSGNRADISTGGGGIRVDPGTHLVVNGSTFFNNQGGWGGAITGSDGTAVMTITNSTFEDNHAIHASGAGGAINNVNGTIINSTFVNNSASTDGGAIRFRSGRTLNLINTIIANNTGNGDCFNDGGTIGIDINNLIKNNGAGINACGTPISTTDPNLGPLQNNGGKTKTMALLAGSPALNAGDSANCAAIDQRGYPRFTTYCDLGAYQTSLLVTNTDDTDNGILSLDDTTLREAIAYGDADSTIGFSASLSGQTIVVSPTIIIDKNLTISSTVPISLSGNNSGAIFQNFTNILTLNNLTIINTKDRAIWNNNKLIIMNSTFRDNLNGWYGGAIDSGGASGELHVLNSTFTNNAANFGGAINVGSGSVAYITNTTISDNSSANGAGIRNQGTLHLYNTIIANSTGADCFGTGTIATNINNLIEDGTCSPAVSGDPNLGPLQDNGGNTHTMALLQGSPAIDAGDNATCLATDQRGISRPQMTTCDIGAYEATPNLEVSNPGDTDDGNYSVGENTLREAINNADPNSLITFDVSLAGQTITLTTELTLSKNLSISSTIPIILNGNNAVPIFNITSGDIMLNNLTLSNGQSAPARAGAIWNNSKLIVMNSTFRDNNGDYGGAIHNVNVVGELHVLNSTFANNTAGFGGAINVGFGSTAYITNTTFSNNNSANGGGIRNPGNLSLYNTIIANSIGPDCTSTGTLVANINNLIEDGTCSPAVSGDPNLGPLQNNGGNTETMALLQGSPAIDAGDNATCLATDQRGVNRPQRFACDIGAYEYQGNDAPIFESTPITSAPYDFSYTYSITTTDGDNDTITLSNTTPVAWLSFIDNGNGTAILTGTPTIIDLGNYPITLQATDGISISTQSFTITVTPPNDPPTAVDDTLTVWEDTITYLDVISNDIDLDGDPLTITTIITHPTNGLASISLSNTIIYTPNNNYFGPDSLVYQITDPFSETDQALVTITVQNINDNPVAISDTHTMDEDTVANINVLANDSDIDSTPLTVTAIITAPTNGIASISLSSTIIYTPTANYFGLDTLVYQISDGDGGTAQAPVSVTILNINDAPVAISDAHTMNEDTVANLDVVANDSDIDSATLTITTIITAPTNGIATLSLTNSLIYTPTANYFGLDTLVYQISDGDGGTAQAPVSITILNINDAPVASDIMTQTSQNLPLPINALASATDIEGDVLVISSTTQPANGTVSIISVPNGGSAIFSNTLLYTPNPPFTGTDTFSYQISDGNGGTDTALITVTVTPNTYPVAVDDYVASNPGQVALTVYPLFNDYDPDRPELMGEYMVDLIDVATPQSGSITWTVLTFPTQPGYKESKVTYTPPPGFYGVDQAVYTIQDIAGASVTGTMYFYVSAISNTLPVLQADTYTMFEDTTLTKNIFTNDIDPDGDPLTFVAVTQPTYTETLSLAPNGDLVYSPTPNFPNGNTAVINSFTYYLTDGQGGLASADVTITLEPVNDAPIANTDWISSTLPAQAIVIDVLANDSDLESETLQILTVTTPSIGSIAISANQTITYTPPLTTFIGTASFEYTIVDDLFIPPAQVNAMVYVTYPDPSNTPPVPNPDYATTAKNVALDIDVLYNDTDPDGDFLTILHVNPALSGTVSINSDSSLHYSPNLDFVGTDSFSYVADDGRGGLVSAMVTVDVTTIAPVNGLTAIETIAQPLTIRLDWTHSDLNNITYFEVLGPNGLSITTTDNSLIDNRLTLAYSTTYTYSVRVYQNGDYSGWKFVSLTTSPDPALDPPAQGSGSISGIVESNLGGSIAEAYICVAWYGQTDPGQQICTTSDTNGNFNVNGLATDAWWTVQATPPISGTFATYLSSQIVTVDFTQVISTYQLPEPLLLIAPNVTGRFVLASAQGVQNKALQQTTQNGSEATKNGSERITIRVPMANTSGDNGIEAELANNCTLVNQGRLDCNPARANQNPARANQNPARANQNPARANTGLARANYNAQPLTPNTQSPTPVKEAPFTIYTLNLSATIDYSQPTWSGLTDRDGILQIGHIPTGTYRLVLDEVPASYPGYYPPEATDFIVSNPLTITNVGDIIVPLATKQINGLVTFTNGDPAPDVTIVATRLDETSNPQIASSNASGAYSLLVSGGVWEVQPIILEGQATNWFFTESPQQITFDLAATPEVAQADFIVQAAAYTITGRILNPDGTPFSGPLGREDALVIAQNTTENLTYSVYPNRDGTFSLPALPGLHDITLWLDQSIHPALGVPLLDPVAVVDSDVDIGDITLISLDGIIQGYVTDQNGDAVPFATVNAWDNQGRWYTGQSDNSGYYFIRVPYGYRIVGPSILAGQPYVFEGSNVEVTLDENNPTATVDIQLTEATRTTQGTFVDLDNDRAIINLVANLSIHRPNNPATPIAVTTLNNGHFSLPWPNDCDDCEVLASLGENSPYKLAQTIQIISNTLEFEVTQNGLGLQGQLLDPRTAQTLANLGGKVTLTPDGSNVPALSTYIQPDGSYNFPYVGTGPFKLSYNLTLPTIQICPNEHVLAEDQYLTSPTFPFNLTMLNPDSYLQLDGIDDYIDLTAHINGIAGYPQGTVSAWFKINSTTTTEKNVLFSYMGDTPLFITIGNGTPLYIDESIYIYGGATESTVIFMVRKGHRYYYDDQWHHIAVVFGDGNNRVYIDGVKEPLTLLGSASTPGFTNSQQNKQVHIGAYASYTVGNNPYHYFKGSINEVSLWNIGLSEEAVINLMNNRVSGAENGLIAHWAFDAVDNTTVYDSGPAGYDGTLINTNSSESWIESTVENMVYQQDIVLEQGSSFRVVVPSADDPSQSLYYPGTVNCSYKDGRITSLACLKGGNSPLEYALCGTPEDVGLADGLDNRENTLLNNAVAEACTVELAPNPAAPDSVPPGTQYVGNILPKATNQGVQSEAKRNFESSTQNGSEATQNGSERITIRGSVANTSSHNGIEGELTNNCNLVSQGRLDCNPARANYEQASPSLEGIEEGQSLDNATIQNLANNQTARSRTQTLSGQILNPDGSLANNGQTTVFIYSTDNDGQTYRAMPDSTGTYSVKVAETNVDWVIDAQVVIDGVYHRAIQTQSNVSGNTVTFPALTLTSTGEDSIAPIGLSFANSTGSKLSLAVDPTDPDLAVSLTIPAGIMPVEQVSLSLAAVPAPNTGKQQVIGHGYTVQFADTKYLRPIKTVLSGDYTFELPYNLNDIRAIYLTEEQLQVAILDTHTNLWQPIPSTLNRRDHNLTVKLNQAVAAIAIIAPWQQAPRTLLPGQVIVPIEGLEGYPFTNTITITIAAETFPTEILMHYIHGVPAVNGTGSFIGSAITDTLQKYAFTLLTTDTNNLPLEAGKKAYTLTVQYDPTDIPVGVNESELGLYRWEAEGWIKQASIVYTPTHQIVATSYRFGYWAILPPPLEPEPPVEPSGTTFYMPLVIKN